MSAAKRFWIRFLAIACACLLAVGGAWGVAYGLRASVAQTLYKYAKFGLLVDTPFASARPDHNQVARLCEVSTRLYGRNYYFATLTSIRSLEAALMASDRETFRRYLGRSDHWTRVALALNPYNIETLQVKCRLLQEQGDKAGAIAFWRDVVLEREFWNPRRHEYFVELCLKAGEVTQAIEASRWLRGGPTLKKVRLIDQRRKALRQKKASGQGSVP